MRWVYHRMRVREQLGYLLSSRVQSAGQVSPTRLSLPKSSTAYHLPELQLGTLIVRSLGREDGRGTTWMKREIDVLSISLSAHVLRTRMGG